MAGQLPSELVLKIKLESKEAQTEMTKIAKQFETGAMTAKTFVKNAGNISPAMQRMAQSMVRAKDATRQANLTMFQFNRIVQDAPFFMMSMNQGFMAISNNIPMFVETIGRARAGGQSFTEIVKGIGKSFTGVGGMISVINLATSAFLAWTISNQQSSSQAKKTSSAIDTLASSMIKFKSISDKPSALLNIDDADISTMKDAIRAIKTNAKDYEISIDKAGNKWSVISGYMDSALLNFTGLNDKATEWEAKSQLVQYNIDNIQDAIKENKNADEAVIKILQDRIDLLNAEEALRDAIARRGLEYVQVINSIKTPEILPETLPDDFDEILGNWDDHWQRALYNATATNKEMSEISKLMGEIDVPLKDTHIAVLKDYITTSEQFTNELHKMESALKNAVSAGAPTIDIDTMKESIDEYKANYEGLTEDFASKFEKAMPRLATSLGQALGRGFKEGEFALNQFLGLALQLLATYVSGGAGIGLSLLSGFVGSAGGANTNGDSVKLDSSGGGATPNGTPPAFVFQIDNDSFSNEQYKNTSSVNRKLVKIRQI